MKGNGKPPRPLSIEFEGEPVPGKIVKCRVRGYHEVEFSEHAQEQMKIRNISEQEVIETIRNPDETGLPTQPNRERFRTYRGSKRAIDVIFEEPEHRLVVVTAMKVTLRGKDQR